MNKGKKIGTCFCLAAGLAVLFLVWIFWGFSGERGKISPNYTVSLESEQIMEEDGTLIYRVILPEDFEKSQTMLFKTTHTIVEVILDESVIYQYSMEKDAPAFLKSPGSLWHFVDVPANSEGGILDVRISPVYTDYYGNEAEFCYGNRSSCVAELFRSFLMILIINCIIVFAGILSILLHFTTYKKRNDEISGFLNVGLFSLMIAVWSLCQSGFLQFLIPDGRTLYFVDLFSFYLFPVPFNLFVYDISRSKYRRIFLWMSEIYLINMAAAVLVQCLGILDIFQILPVTHAIMAANVLCIIMVIHREAADGENSYAGKFRLPLYTAVLFAATELVAYYARGFRQTSVFLPLGTISFIVMLIWILVVRYYEGLMQEQKIAYLKKMANMDMLTEALNRNAYENTVKYMEEKEIEIRTAGVLIFDVNDMKMINDNYGHEQGDEALKYCYQCICGAFHAEGNCFRIGGDEFACVFNVNEKPEIQKEIEMFDSLVEEIAEKVPFPFSVAVGYASYEEGVDEDFKDIVRRGDAMMYRKKRKKKLLRNHSLSEKIDGLHKGHLEIGYTDKVFQKKQYQKLRVEELCEFIDLMNPSTDDYQYVLDFRTDFYYIAPHALNRFYLEVNSFHNVMETHRKFVYEEDYELLKAEFDDLLSTDRCVHNMEYRWLDHNGQPVWINCRGYVVRDDDGKALYMVGCINEIGAKQKADNVSGLLGEFSLEEYLGSLSGEFRDGCVLRLGIDDFKEINEKFGIEYGDMILRETADCASRCVRNGQRLYKLQADELLILDLSGGKPVDMKVLYEQIREAVAQFVEDNGFEIVFTVSGGIIPCDSLEKFTYSNIMKISEFALNEARREGKNRCYLFEKKDYAAFLRRRGLTRILRKSVNHGYEGFEAYYQPVFSTQDNRMYGAEVLMRFYSEEFGWVSPKEFIPILEATGLIIPTGRWILGEALKVCRLTRESIPEFHVSVNFSHIQVAKTNLLQDIVAEIRRADVPASALVVELTESGILEADQSASWLWQEMNDMGIKLALDDFGTGYSNFHYLTELKPYIIKIDRSFVAKAMASDEEYALLYLLSSMTHKLNLKLCIEGVENEIEWARVQKLQPDFCQGYFWGRPCAYEVFVEKFLKKTDPYHTLEEERS